MNPAHPKVVRQYYLDWLRVVAFAILIPYHVGMYYVSWDWHVKSPILLSGLETWMRLFSPWRMDLLFVVSGAAISHLLNRRGASFAVLRHRVSRLLWPLMFGVLIVVPPQSYLEVVQRFGYFGSYLEFLRLYLLAYGGFCNPNGRCLILPTWNHLWYLPNVLFYTTALWLLLAWRQQWLDRLASWVDKKVGSIAILLLPIGFLVLAQVFLGRRFPITHALLDDWFAHSQYFAMFMFGVMLARGPQLVMQAEKLRWLALILALLAWTIQVNVQVGSVIGRAWPDLPPSIFFSIQQWCAILAALGFGHSLLNFDARARAYLNDAVFPMYIVHQTLIMVFAKILSAWLLNPGVELVLLLLATLAASLLFFEGARRAGRLRVLLGLNDR